MVEQGKKGGRPSDKNHAEIWKMFNIEGKSGAEIARELNIPTTTLYSTEGWKSKGTGYRSVINGKNYPGQSSGGKPRIAKKCYFLLIFRA